MRRLRRRQIKTEKSPRQSKATMLHNALYTHNAGKPCWGKESLEFQMVATAVLVARRAHNKVDDEGSSLAAVVTQLWSGSCETLAAG